MTQYKVVKGTRLGSVLVKQFSRALPGWDLAPPQNIIIAYTEEINSVFADHRLDHHCFADDTQAYVATVPSQAHTIAPRLQHCIADVAAWCGARRLQLNPLKTEIMWFGSATALRNLPSSVRAVNVGSVVLQPASVVRMFSWCPTEHANARLQNDTNVLLPPPATATGSTATWS